MKHLCQHYNVYAPNLAILLGIACSCMPFRRAVGEDVEAMVGGSVASNSLSLRAATDLALTNNPDLAARAAGVRGAGERVKALSAARWPSIGLSGSYSEYLDDVRLAPASYNGEQGGTFGADFLEGGLTLRLPLYTGGKLTSDIRAADFLAQSAEGLLARSRCELIFNVRSVFYAMLAQVHLIESVDFSVQAIDEHLKRVNELVEAQKAARVDALRTEVCSAELRQQLIEARKANSRAAKPVQTGVRI